MCDEYSESIDYSDEINVSDTDSDCDSALDSSEDFIDDIPDDFSEDFNDEIADDYSEDYAEDLEEDFLKDYSEEDFEDSDAIDTVDFSDDIPEDCIEDDEQTDDSVDFEEFDDDVPEDISEYDNSFEFDVGNEDSEYDEVSEDLDSLEKGESIEQLGADYPEDVIDDESDIADSSAIDEMIDGIEKSDETSASQNETIDDSFSFEVGDVDSEYDKVPENLDSLEKGESIEQLGTDYPEDVIDDESDIADSSAIDEMIDGIEESDETSASQNETIDDSFSFEVGDELPEYDEVPEDLDSLEKGESIEQLGTDYPEDVIVDESDIADSSAIDEMIDSIEESDETSASQKETIEHQDNNTGLEGDVSDPLEEMFNTDIVENDFDQSDIDSNNNSNNELNPLEEMFMSEDNDYVRQSTEAFESNEINSVSDYMNAHNYGRDDFDIYSQDPQWRELMQKEYPDYELPPMEGEISSVSDYMNSHNYGQDDFDTYSQDPQWRELMQKEYPDYELPPLYGEHIVETKDIDDSTMFGSCPVEQRIDGTDYFVKGDSYNAFINDFYTPEELTYEAFDAPKEIEISPCQIEGIHIGEREIENPDIFWGQHKNEGSIESFKEIAKQIPSVKDKLESGISMSELLEDPELSECAGIYFDQKTEVIENDGYYEFCSNGRHRILAAREVGNDIPVRVIGRRKRL